MDGNGSGVCGSVVVETGCGDLGEDCAGGVDEEGRELSYDFSMEKNIKPKELEIRHNRDKGSKSRS